MPIIEKGSGRTYNSFRELEDDVQRRRGGNPQSPPVENTPATNRAGQAEDREADFAAERVQRQQSGTRVPGRDTAKATQRFLNSRGTAADLRMLAREVKQIRRLDDKQFEYWIKSSAQANVLAKAREGKDREGRGLTSGGNYSNAGSGPTGLGGDDPNQPGAVPGTEPVATDDPSREPYGGWLGTGFRKHDAPLVEGDNFYGKVSKSAGAEQYVRFMIDEFVRNAKGMTREQIRTERNNLIDVLAPMMTSFAGGGDNVSQQDNAAAYSDAIDLLENYPLEDLYAQASDAQGSGGGAGFTSATSPSDQNWLTKMFPGLDTSTLPVSELRPLDETAFGAVRDANPGAQSPFLAQTQQRRGQEAVGQFGLEAALGKFGQYGVENNRVELGGRGLQDLMKGQAVTAAGGAPTTSSHQGMFQAAQRGLGEDNGQAASIMAALGITNSDSAREAYGGINTGFVQPRLNNLPGGIRHIFQAGANKEIENLLGGRGSAEINPATYIQELLNKGLLR